MKKLITVFGPSEALPGDQSYDEALLLGALLAEAEFGIINGGYGGVMEAVSKGSASNGGGAIGVTAEVYYARGREVNEFITREVKVKSHVDRLMELLDLADAYVAVGVSPGTLVEVATAWEFMVKQFFPPKPIVLIGEEWRRICDVLFTQQYYFGKSRAVKLVDIPEEAIEYLVEKFGPQEKLPELNVMS